MAKINLRKTDFEYRITLNDQPLNILDIEMLGELRDALSQVQPDRALVVFDAAGEKAFSAGASVQDHIGERVQLMLQRFHDCFRILDRIDLVTVALVKGVALGGGCELALACDLVLASEKAKFGQPEINLGVFPPVAAYQLSRQLAPKKGLELLLTGDSVDAATAAALGLVNAVLPFDGFEAAADQWLAKLHRHSPSTLRFTKKAFRVAAPRDFSTRLDDVERLYLEELMASADASEGLNAFLEKRKPAWRG